MAQQLSVLLHEPIWQRLTSSSTTRSTRPQSLCSSLFVSNRQRSMGHEQTHHQQYHIRYFSFSMIETKSLEACTVRLTNDNRHPTNRGWYRISSGKDRYRYWNDAPKPNLQTHNHSTSEPLTTSTPPPLRHPFRNRSSTEGELWTNCDASVGGPDNRNVITTSMLPIWIKQAPAKFFMQCTATS
jgi:hypothetical protein